MSFLLPKCREGISTQKKKWKEETIYIMSNKTRTVLYIGVTSALYWRVLEHKSGEGSEFTSKFNCTDLVYFETFSTIEESIKREKVLKKWK